MDTQNEEEGREVSENGVTIVIHKTKEKDKTSSLDTRAVKILSIIHIISGIVVIICQIGMDIGSRNNFTIQEGIIVGIFYLATGIVGIFLSRAPTKRLAIAFQVMSILSSLWSIILLVFSSLGFSFGGTVVIVLNAFKVIISVTQGIVTIISAALCCKVFCCTKEIRKDRFQSFQVKILSISQICIGLLFIIFFFVNTIGIDQFSIGEEIWCSAFFIIAGILGIFAARNVSSTLVTSFLILNIFGSLFCIVLITTTAIKTSMQENTVYYDEWNLRNDLEYLKRPTKCENAAYYADKNETKAVLQSCREEDAKEIKRIEHELEVQTYRENHDLFMTMLSFQLILILLETGITIWSIILSCRACCCVKQADTTAVYIPQSELQAGNSVIHVTKNSTEVQDRFANENTQDKYSRLE